MGECFAWTAVGFLLGSMPFSHWITMLLVRKDVRLYGDGNPGAVNAWRAGGWRCGVPALLLDFSKAAVPVHLAISYGRVGSWCLVPVALAPVFGHAFSPFLGFRGGKAIASTFGIWSGLTLWEVPTVFGVFLSALVLIQKVDAWSAVIGMACLMPYLLLRNSPETFLVIWAVNFAVLLWKHRRDLTVAPSLRPWVKRALGAVGERFPF
jgi:glycerol-3-phosphate acyltransferase PlsY